jgi:hypothetical protein
LKKEVPHAEETHDAGDISIKGYDGQILAVGVLEKSKGLVVELTCGVDLCRDHAQAMALLRRVLGRAERLGAETPAPAKEPEKKPEPESQPEIEKKPEGEPAETEKKEEPQQQPEDDKQFQLKPPGLHR